MFILFALFILFLPLSITGTVRQYVYSWFQPIAGSAETAAGAADGIVDDEPGRDDPGTNDGREKEMRSRLIEARLEIMELRNLLNMRNELRRLELRRVPYIYLTRILSIGESSPWRRSITIDRGEQQPMDKPGLIPGLALTTGRRMIGRVTEVGPHTSRVQLITDPDFRLKVIALPPDGKIPEEGKQFPNPSVYLHQRTGIIEGTGGGTLKLTEVLASVFIKTGWEVISAGEPDDPIPRGLLLGTVQTVSETHGQFKKIVVRPSFQIRDVRTAMVLRPRGSVAQNQ